MQLLVSFDFSVEVDNIYDVTRVPCTCFMLTRDTWKTLLRNSADPKGRCTSGNINFFTMPRDNIEKYDLT